ncbi:MAG: PilZ domain-containing protein [Anaeromyxobacter sp.]
MPIMKWLRPSTATQEKPAATRRPTPARSLAAVPLKTAPAPAEVIPLDARALVGAWSPGSSRVVIKCAEPLGEGRRVALRLTGEAGLDAPVLGTVKVARPVGGAYAAEVEIDEDRQATLHRVRAYLEGLAPTLRARDPRFRVTLPAVVSAGGGQVYMSTFSLSRGGCGLVWSGMKPLPNSILDVKVGLAQAAGAQFRARVCWARQDGKAFKVGLRFLAGGDQLGLARLLEDAKGKVEAEH